MRWAASAAAESSLALDRKQIHVREVSLCATTDDLLLQAYRVLSADERRRADRFHTAVLRGRFILARWSMRRLLSVYVKSDPKALLISCGPHGKPWLPDYPQLCFNLSHAGAVALFAVAWQRQVGIDIEARSPNLDYQGVAELAFSNAECEALAALPPAARADAFLRIWVRKEAYVKARGEGLAYSTRSFTVSHVDHQDDRIFDHPRHAAQTPDWRVTKIAAPAGYVAALAARGQHWRVVPMDDTTSLAS